MAVVKNSLTLDSIINSIRNDRRIIWYVARNGTVKRIFISSNMYKHSFVREHNFVMELTNLNTTTVTHEDGNSGQIYDKYYKSGHFFLEQSSAFKYLLLRISTNSPTLVKTAKDLLHQYPEYSI